ncbi:hypothetical protein D3C83_170250 [compost metagenome]
MYAPLGLRFRYTLHAVGAGFEFEARINILAADAHDDFFVAAVLAFAFADHLGLPSFPLGIAAVHTV